MTNERIGRLLDVPKSTVGYLIRRHNKLRILVPLPKKGNKFQIKETPEVSAAIMDDLDRDCSLTLEDLKLFVIPKYRIPTGISISSIYHLLERFSYTLKNLRLLPFGRNSERTKD